MTWCAAHDPTVKDSGEEPHQVDSGLDGPTKERSCRDVIFLIIFILFLGGLGFVFYRAISLGHPFRLMYGMDSWGNTCNMVNKPIPGVNMSGRDTTGLSHVFYYNPSYLKAVTGKDPLSDLSSIVLCVSECPTQIISSSQDLRALAQNGSKLCYYDVDISDYDIRATDGSGKCPPLPVKPHSSLLNRCVPSDISRILQGLGERLQGLGERLHTMLDLIDDNFAEKSVEDLERTWKEILYMCSFSLVVAAVLLVLLRFFAGPIVWINILLVVLGVVGGTAFCWYSYSKEGTQNWLWGSIGATLLTVIILLILLALRKRLKLVVQLFREAGKAVGNMPLTLLMPFVTLLIAGGIAAAMVYVFLYIATAKHPVVTKSGFVTYKQDKITQYLLAYYILGFFWLTQFIFACQRLVVSGAVSMWYFTRDKKQLHSPIYTSLKRLLRYHLGSVALGSLIIALVKFIRLGLSFIESRLKGADNPVAQFFLKCLSCCLWCFERFLKYLNDNAYIQIAINGYSFCKAARQAFLLIVNNALRVAAINCVGDFLLFMGKVGTVAVVAVLGLELLKGRTDIHYIWLPIAVSCVFAYFISSCFLAVYEMTIDALFVCFVEDSEKNNGVERPYYMSKGLMDLVANGRKAKAMAEKALESV